MRRRAASVISPRPTIARPSRACESCSRSCRRTTRKIRLPGLKASSDPVDREVPELDQMIPIESNKPYDIKNVVRAVVDDGRFFEVHDRFAMNIVVGFARVGGLSIGVVANQPQVLAGCLDIKASLKGRALRALLRLLQHSSRHVFRRRARLPPRNGPRVRRHHHPRSEAALCVRGGDRAEGHGDHAQGLWRRIRRDELEAHPRRLQPRVPDGGDRRHGPRGRGQHRLSQRDPRGPAMRPSRGHASSKNTNRSSRTPTRRQSSASSTRSFSRASSVCDWHARSSSCGTSATRIPPRKHGNIPL